MYVMKNTFKAKPGKADALIEKFKAAAPHLAADGVEHRILVDQVADYWTVIVEAKADDLDAFFAFRENEAAREAMSGYMDMVVEGNRTIYRVAYEG